MSVVACMSIPANGANSPEEIALAFVAHTADAAAEGSCRGI